MISYLLTGCKRKRSKVLKICCVLIGSLADQWDYCQGYMQAACVQN